MTTTSEQQAVPVAQEDEARATLAAEMLDNHAASSFLAGKDRLISTRAALRAMHRFARLTPIEGVAAVRDAFSGVMRGEVLDAGAWSLHLHFGRGDGARDRMRAASDLLASIVTATPSPAIPEGTSGEGVGDKANHDCLAKRRPGEPMFILLGRDPDAWQIVRAWAARRLNAGGDPEHVMLGLNTANAMRDYAADPANRPASAPDANAYPRLDATQTREAELVAVRMHALEEAAMIAQIFGVPGGHISDTARKVAEAIRFRATTLVPPKATPIAARKHALRRTSPKGGPFLGTCMQCGETGLPSNAVLKPCTNPANLTQDESMLLAIKPADSAPSSVPDELRQDLEDAVSVLERLPYGNWPGDMYHGKVAAANGLIRRLRAALSAGAAKGEAR